jgi:peroxiredoxin
MFPHLSKIYKERQSKGLVVVGISVDDDAGLQAFVQREGDRMAYTVAVDKERVHFYACQVTHVSGLS